MNPGRLRERVVIQSKATDNYAFIQPAQPVFVSKMIDNEGITTAQYDDVGKLWAEIKPNGGEIAQRKYGIVDDGISLMMITRPNANVSEQNRVIYNRRTYEIRYVARYRDRYESLLRVVAQ